MKPNLRLLFLVLVLAAPLGAASMFRGDAAHGGTYASAPLRSLHGMKWSFATGGPIVGSATVWDGCLYVGSDDRRLYALDPATGTKRWSFTADGPVRSTPAVDHTGVYFLSYDGLFHALDPKSGAPRWTFKTGGERHFEARGLHGMHPATQTIPDVWDMYSSSATLADGLVFFGCGDGCVYALREADGSVAWRFQTGDVVHASPAVADGLVVVGSWDSMLYALDERTGAVRWKFKTGEDPVNHNQVGFQSSPTIVNGTVYVGCRDAHVYAVDLKTGTQRWTYSTKGSWVIGTPVVHDGAVWVGTSDTGQLMALDARTGALLHSLDMKIYTFSSVAVAGEFGYVGTFDGRLHAVDLASAREVWNFQTDAGRADRGHVLGADGRQLPTLFQVDSDPTAPPFQYEWMGRIFDRLYELGSFVSSPVVSDGVVYAGSADGRVYALE
ncbi:serine/threonine-protein kinase AfsK [mine drainage metagenome]|uniref:Serine/threonine-protein kinase AfsK n=1 Tax=mine drainage metagenome TaxID=410659 RepID=A0A1J5SMJ1_9ZZZZ